MKTIMVVDDEAGMLDQVKKILEDDDFQVITADSNRRAIELMSKDEEEKYGLILINTKLPESKIPAFFSMKPSSKMNIDTSKKADFLQKPFTPEELKTFVKNKINI
jgi:DNA-binding NtrC family response regulator